MQGRWVQAYPDLARRIAAAGHLVGNHSFYHARLPLLSDTGLLEDISAAHEVIIETIGVDARPWFRCPFGAGTFDARVLRALGSLGYRDFEFDVPAVVDGSVVVGDWQPGQTGESVADWVVRGVVERGDPAVVVLHSWPAPTLAALPTIINRLRTAGATFVRLDEIEVTSPD
jgi:peptidoglycan/xylan/chitin deacetylase (PgdA/CDA1 family)